MRFKPFTGQGDPGGFNFKEFRSNTVLRWEYRPGSTLFLVWAQGREIDGVANDFSFRRDLRTCSTPPEQYFPGEGLLLAESVARADLRQKKSEPLKAARSFFMR